MPNRARIPPAKPKSRLRASFRARYDDLETQRVALLRRLNFLHERCRAHPGYKHAQKLLNEMFRRSSIAQRVGILQAATWLIDVLEQVPFV
jgi:hypothetical protein